jgi:hypothetical protein
MECGVMFIEIGDCAINADFIAYVYFYEDKYTYKPCCLITLKDDMHIRIEDGDQVIQLKNDLSNVGVAVMAIEQGEEE